MNLTQLFFTWDTRIGRKPYWAAMGVFIVIAIVPELFGSPVSDVVGGLVSLAMIYPQICILAKRLHDLGLSGWWQLAPAGALIALILIWVATMAAGAVPGTDAGDITLGLFVLVGVVGYFGFYIWLGAARGQPQPNRWGPPPGRGAATTAEVFS